MHPFLKEYLKKIFLFASKATFVFFLVVITTLFAAWQIDKADDTDVQTFSVAGTASRYVAPDKVVLTLGTILDGKDILKIQEDANTAVNNAVEAIKLLGIDESKIQTSNYNMEPDYDWNTGKIDGYTINVSIVVTIEDVTGEDNLVGDVISSATGAGLNEVRGLTYDVTNRDAITEELKAEAIDDAKSKKDALADASGLKLGSLKNISFYNNTPYSTRSYMYAEDMVAAAEPSPDVKESIQINPGENKIEVNVTLYYEIK